MGNAESGEPEYHDIVLTGEAEPQALRGDGARLEEVMSRSRSSSDPRAKKRPSVDKTRKKRAGPAESGAVERGRGCRGGCEG